MTVRIGILIGTMSGGGAQRVALDLMEHLPQAGFDPFLLSVDRLDGPSANGWTDAIGKDRALSLSGARVEWPTWRKVVAAPLQLARLRKVSRRLGLDVVLSLMERANILNLLGGSGPRRIISVHSHPRLMMEEKTWLKRTLVRAMYGTVLRRADRVVFVSHEAALEAPSVFPALAGGAEVIHNMCDPNRVERLARESLPPKESRLFNEPVVLACGRLIAAKGHAGLIRAMSALRHRSRARLVILGDGPLRASLRQLVDRLNLRGRVFLPGFQSNPIAWMARAQVFVLPSLREGLPLALLEAMGSGTPVIAADCSSGPREILAPETDPRTKAARPEWAPYGVLVPPLSSATGPAPIDPAEKALADAIARLLEDDTWRARYAVAGPRRARDFAPDRIIPQWADLIGRTLQTPDHSDAVAAGAPDGAPEYQR